jgi:dTDP-4-amino-4,6-dideoxygalactose transaminase
MNIQFHKAYITDEDINGVVDALKSGWITMGPKTIEFEEKFREYIDNKFAVSCNSATAALHLALKAIGLKENDEVIIPTNTFIATAEVITYFNAKPILCDIDSKTHNIDVTKIEKLINDKTRAIIPVHFGGQPCDMDEIFEIAGKYNLKVIEDAAHALPSTYKGDKIGSLSKSDITCFSFYATKTLATGEGGMAVTSNEEYAKKMKVNRLHGIAKDAWDRYTNYGSWYYEVIDNGNKYNTTDINSALGISQLKKVDWMMKKRQEIALKYNHAFSKCKKIEIPFIKPDRETSWHLYVIKVENRNKLIERLKKNGVGCSVHFIPVHKHPYYKERYKYVDSNYPVANEVFEKSLSLPIYPGMDEYEINYVIETVLKEVEKI